MYKSKCENCGMSIQSTEAITTCPLCSTPLIILTPKVDALAALLEYFTEEQLLQLAEKCNRAQYASQGDGQAEVFVRFMNGRPRFFGVQTWEEAQK